MTTVSQRLAILKGVQLLWQGFTNPNTSLPLYADVKRGAYFGSDMQQFASWAEVTPYLGQSGPSGSGGSSVGWRIEDAFTVAITSGWDYETDSTFAVDACATTMDVVLPIIHSHPTIPDPVNPLVPIATVWDVRMELADKALPVRVPNGHVYLMWHLYVAVRQQYSVLVQSP